MTLNVFVIWVSCLQPPRMASHSVVSKVIRNCVSSLMWNTYEQYVSAILMFCLQLAFLLFAAKTGKHKYLSCLTFWHISVCTSCIRHNHAIKFLFPSPCVCVLWVLWTFLNNCHVFFDFILCVFSLPHTFTPIVFSSQCWTFGTIISLVKRYIWTYETEICPWLVFALCCFHNLMGVTQYFSSDEWFQTSPKSQNYI